MATLVKAVVFLSFAASALSLSDHNMVRSVHHRGIAGRVAAPVPVDVIAERDVVVLHKRANRRCKPRPATPPPQKTTEDKPKDDDKPAKAAAPDPPKAPEPPKEDPKPEPKPQPKPDPPKGGNGNEPSFMHGVQRGQGTFYATGLGACGIVNKDTDYIAAVSHQLFDSYPGWDGRNPNNNPMCGRKIRASFGGKSVVVAATDRCEGCKLTDLDFSPSAFSQLNSFDVGRFDGMEWEWV